MNGTAGGRPLDDIRRLLMDIPGADEPARAAGALRLLTVESPHTNLQHGGS